MATGADISCRFYDHVKGLLLRHFHVYSKLKHVVFVHYRNIKTSDFSYADLSHAHLEHLVVDGPTFTGAKIDQIYFENNDFHGSSTLIIDLSLWIKQDNL